MSAGGNGILPSGTMVGWMSQNAKETTIHMREKKFGRPLEKKITKKKMSNPLVRAQSVSSFETVDRRHSSTSKRTRDDEPIPENITVLVEASCPYLQTSRSAMSVPEFGRAERKAEWSLRGCCTSFFVMPWRSFHV